VSLALACHPIELFFWLEVRQSPALSFLSG